MALILQTILTFIVTDKRGLDLGERDQVMLSMIISLRSDGVTSKMPVYRVTMKRQEPMRFH